MAKKSKDGSDSPGFSEKWDKHLSSEWKTSSESKSNDELKKEIVDAEHGISDFEKDMEADGKITTLKDDIADKKDELKKLTDAYTEGSKACQAQIRYCIYLLKGRGIGASSTSTKK